MEDKKQDVKSLEELIKEVNAYSGRFAILADELSKVLADIKAPDEEENTWEMKCSYKYDRYWFIYSDSYVDSATWFGGKTDKGRFKNGNVFPTKEAAELEVKRRNLLTRFRAFRNECNEDWNPDWSGNEEIKAYIQYHARFNKFVIKYTLNCDVLQTFGFFKCKQDALRAIELFGDEIIELFVDCEVQ